MRRKKRSRESNTATEDTMINLTPLIDVVFVVLIMFMIVAPMLELDRVELAPGNHSAMEDSAIRETSPLSIHVRHDNTIWMNKQRVTPKQLMILLKEAKRRYPGKRPQLYHDERAQFGTYQRVKNAVEDAGFLEMDVILKPA